jgi:hypothetical protein
MLEKRRIARILPKVPALDVESSSILDPQSLEP